MTRYKWRQVPGYVFLSIFSIFSLFPLYFMVVSATNTSTDVLASRLLPGGNLAKNFSDLLAASDLWSVLTNSAVIAVGNQPAKPFRVGRAVEEGVVLQSVSGREARLGPSVDGPASITLQLSLPDKR